MDAIDGSDSNPALEQGLRFGFLDAETAHAARLAPALIANREGNTMLRALRRELRVADTFTFSVAFVTPGAIAMLKQELIDFSGHGRIITSDYLLFNSPRAFRELLALENVDTFVYRGGAGLSRAFHAKGYLFRQGEITTGIVGSSNLTESALASNVEWNLRVSALRHSGITAMLDSELEAQLAASSPLTQAWVDLYSSTWQPVRSRGRSTATGDLFDLLESDRVAVELGEGFEGDHAPSAADDPRLRPNAMQRRALASLQRLRDAGERRAVIISATGTGKTLLSAFDVQAANPRRLLFIVHREQILRRAIEEYRRVLPGEPADFGLFSGNEKQTDKRYVFATVQSLSASDVLNSFDSEAFDYIVIDEVHRSAAAGYQRVLEHFTPRFLLGMTATPERTDGADIFRAFDYNTAYEIRLNEALEAEMLCPFHYYGVSEYLTDDGERHDDPAELSRLTDPERVHYILRQISLHAQAGIDPKGIIFCSRNKEAVALAGELNGQQLHGRRLRTAAVTGADSQQRRDALVADLREGRLDYLLTVDIFNEGIDIPEVNQIVMLRQTQSSIVFVQQLGRGLRKAPGKDYLVVIDFIGNYRNNYLIPTALFGDRTRNKDTLRRQMRRAISEGTLSGVSTVSFDRIATQRVLSSIDAARIDGRRELLEAYRELRSRRATPPRLLDFAEAGAVDPVVLATRFGNYAHLLTKAGEDVPVLPPWQDAVLTFVTQELLDGRRRADLIVLRDALGRARQESPSTSSQREAALTDEQVASVGRILDLSFFTKAERRSYGDRPLVVGSLHAASRWRVTDDLADAYLTNGYFAQLLDDTIETGLYVNEQRYDGGSTLVIGRKYGRKDALRILNWKRNEASTVYGYKAHLASHTCPIFVTYHKSEEVIESIRYEDAFIDERTFSWFSRSRRTLNSPEVRHILDGDVDLYLFVKKSDAEGSDFYYLGQASPRAAEAVQLAMPSEAGDLPVVRVPLDLEHPVEASLYDFLTLGTDS